MFLSEEAQFSINALRGKDNNTEAYKAEICDAISIIMSMHQTYASEKEKRMLVNAVGTLSNYNELLTELSKEK